MRYDVMIKDKYALTLDEAAAYFGIGVNALRQIIDRTDVDNNCVLHVGVKRLIKKDKFSKFLDGINVL